MEDDAAARFARAMLPHLDAAYRLARWMVRDGVTAQDVAQDALVRALTYFGSFRGENPRAWLLQIVRTTALTRLAGRVETPLEAVHAEVPSAGASPEEAYEGVQREGVLARAVAALPEELRACLVLREFEEMSYREIAEITGVPVGTVMSRLHRARRALLEGTP